MKVMTNGFFTHFFVIDCGTSARDTSSYEVTVRVDGDIVTIVDDGNGITESESPYIFERYYRGTNTDDARGSGLGMAISRDIIEAHGGKVEVESAPGHGTTIRITFMT